MGFLDTLTGLAGAAGGATGNPWLTGIGLAGSLFGHKSKDPAQQAAEEAANRNYGQADALAKYYQTEAELGKNQESALQTPYQKAFQDSLTAHQGGYFAGTGNDSQRRAALLGGAASATQQAYAHSAAQLQADMARRGMSDSGLAAGALAGLAANRARTDSQNTVALNSQIHQEDVQNADWTANAYEQRLAQARAQASSATGAGINYFTGAGNRNQSRSDRLYAAQEANNGQYNNLIGQLGGQFGAEVASKNPGLFGLPTQPRAAAVPLSPEGTIPAYNQGQPVPTVSYQGTAPLLPREPLTVGLNQTDPTQRGINKLNTDFWGNTPLPSFY